MTKIGVNPYDVPIDDLWDKAEAYDSAIWDLQSLMETVSKLKWLGESVDFDIGACEDAIFKFKKRMEEISNQAYEIERRCYPDNKPFM